MKLFGEDPKISRLLQRQVDAQEIQIAELKRERDSYKSVNESLYKSTQALTQENTELKQVALKLKEQLLKAPRDRSRAGPPNFASRLTTKHWDTRSRSDPQSL